MSIRCKKLQAEIESDLDWRLAELAVLREMLALNKKDTIRSRVLFRSAWAMLYAHYEGFCKSSFELFSEFLSKNLSCQELPHCTFLYLHEASFRNAKNLSIAETYEFYTSTLPSLRASPPPTISVDTKSNLWPNVLDRLLLSFDLDAATILNDRLKIKALVGQRNDIAHGKKVFIKDYAYYLEYENATQNLMYALAIAIVEKSYFY